MDAPLYVHSRNLNPKTQPCQTQHYARLSTTLTKMPIMPTRVPNAYGISLKRVSRTSKSSMSTFKIATSTLVARCGKVASTLAMRSSVLSISIAAYQDQGLMSL